MDLALKRYMEGNCIGRKWCVDMTCKTSEREEVGDSYGP